VPNVAQQLIRTERKRYQRVRKEALPTPSAAPEGTQLALRRTPPMTAIKAFITGHFSNSTSCCYGQGKKLVIHYILRYLLYPKESGKRNSIYLFYETVSKNAEGQPGKPGDKHYKCYHGNRKVLTITRAMRGSLNGEFFLLFCDSVTNLKPVP